MISACRSAILPLKRGAISRVTVPSPGIMECLLDDRLPLPIYGAGLHAGISLNRKRELVGLRFRTAVLASSADNV
jgi:hypothetical protein